jgi:predicted XRE-type DNA-binding protein
MKNKKLMENKNDNSTSFNDFMRKQGLYAEARVLGMKRHLISLLEQAMKEKKLSKSDMAMKMCTSRPAIDNILDPCYNSSLKTLVRFASLLDKEITISLRDLL